MFDQTLELISCQGLQFIHLNYYWFFRHRNMVNMAAIKSILILLLVFKNTIFYCILLHVKLVVRAFNKMNKDWLMKVLVLNWVLLYTTNNFVSLNTVSLKTQTVHIVHWVWRSLWETQ